MIPNLYTSSSFREEENILWNVYEVLAVEWESWLGVCVTGKDFIVKYSDNAA